jgi:hypothetical protein
MAILSCRRPGRRILLHPLVPLALLLVHPPSSAAAQAETPRALEYRVKAAYLLNFSRYVAWPPGTFAGPVAPIRLCVLGQDPFGTTLEQTVADQRTQGREVQSLRVDTPERAVSADCQVLYVGRDHRGPRGWQEQLRGTPIITVGEGEGFLYEGGMIGFVLSEETVRFAVSLPALHAAGLQISSRVLNLATRVIPDSGRP